MNGRRWEHITKRMGACVVFAGCSLTALARGQAGREPPPLAQTTRESAAAPVVALRLDGNWPAVLAKEVGEDVDASLAERGVDVLLAPAFEVVSDNGAAVGAPGSARGTLRIFPPSETEGRFRVVVEDSGGRVIAERDVSLVEEHPDTWSVAIAAAADELLAAAWRLPPRRHAAAGEENAPTPPSTASDAASETTVPTSGKRPPPKENEAKGGTAKPNGVTAQPTVATAGTTSEFTSEWSQNNAFELGFGGAAERYFPNSWSLGGEVFFGIPLGRALFLDAAVLGRKLVARSSAEGQVDGLSAGAHLALRGPVRRGERLDLDWVVGLHGARVWFDATARDGAVATPGQGVVLSARGGVALRVHASSRTWFGLRGTAGVPLIRAEARDSTGAVLRLSGFESAARMEVGWRL